jgi:dipeptidyl aminopeptidase/acylaminoacyl peptidase
MYKKMLMALMIFVPVCTFAQNGRLPTLEDAAAVKSTGTLSVNPDERSIAMEAEGGILIVQTRRPFAPIKKLDGRSPSWSPDGRSLAFYKTADGEAQIYVWRRSTDTVEKLTSIPSGISPSPFMLSADQSLAWSPDSSSIAFCTRLMGDYKKEGRFDTDGVRVFSASGRTWLPVLANVFHNSSFWDAYFPGNPEFAPDRMRAVERHPDWGLSNLFTVNVQTKELRKLTQKGQHFAPAWSADGSSIIALTEAGRGDGDEFPNAAPWIRKSEIAIFDVKTGLETRIAPPSLSESSEYEFIGPATWSKDGAQIVIWEKTLPSKFARVQVYSMADRQWRQIAAPRGMNTAAVGWSRNGRSLLLRASDRFVDSYWYVDPRSGAAEQIDTGDSVVSELAIVRSGDIYFVAQGPNFQGRVYKKAAAAKSVAEQIYDPNPQLANLILGEQRRVTWTNKAGDEVDGVIILPPGYVKGQRYPVIVDPYPKPPRNGFKLNSNPEGSMGQLEAARGYVIFMPGLRAPHGGYNFTHDENYTEKARGAPGVPIMVDDFTSGIGYLAREGIADADRVGLFGHSNGGYVSNFLITETNIAKCAVLSPGMSSILTAFPLFSHLTPGFEFTINANMNLTDNMDDHIKLSPILKMKNVTAAVLLILGDDDWEWVPQMIDEFGTLRSLGKDVQLVRYADEGHEFHQPKSIRDSFDRENAFFDRCLAPRP